MAFLSHHNIYHLLTIFLLGGICHQHTTAVCCLSPQQKGRVFDPNLLSIFTYFIKSLVPGRFNFNFKEVIFKLTLVNGGWVISDEIAFRWMPLDLFDDKSTLDQVMACCRQATSHYLSQCWPRSLTQYGITRPQYSERAHCSASIPTGHRKFSTSAWIYYMNHTILQNIKLPDTKLQIMVSDWKFDCANWSPVNCLIDRNGTEMVLRTHLALH